MSTSGESNATLPVSIEGIYARLFPLIASKCRRMLGDSFEAEDVAQEAFTRLWAHRHEIQNLLGSTAWLYRTSTRLAIDRMRQNKMLPLQPAGGPEPSAPQTPDGPGEAREILKSIALRMPREELEVLVLSRVDGLTHPEIAEVLVSSERTVRRRLLRAEDRLGRMFPLVEVLP